MSEKKTIVDSESISYKGLFAPQELYKIIDKYFKEKGYDKRYLANEEHVSADHKDVFVVIMPFKKLSDYDKSEIKMVINFTDLKEIEKTIDKVKIKLYNGNVNIILSGYLTTDYEGKWATKPHYFFLRTFINKFLYPTETAKMEGIVAQHVKEIKDEIFSFLNMKRWA